MYNEELVDICDLFENDDVVIIKATYKTEDLIIERIEAGVKEPNGDVLKIIRISEKYIKTKAGLN